MNTLFTGQNIIELERVNSTNSHAAELLKNKPLAEGTLIITKEQIEGRGQRGNSWISESGKNITCSFIFYPTFLNIEKQFMLTKLISLAVADVLSIFLKDNASIKIKWPNDIYVNEKKIAGILIENSLKQNTISSSIFGIGLNVGQENFSEILTATSMKIISGKEFEPRAVIEKLCSCLESRYLQLRSGKNELIDLDYLKLLYQINEWKNYSIQGIVTEGKILGVTEIGKLKMEFKKGEKKEFDLKEISFV